MTISRKCFGELAEAILEGGMVKAIQLFDERTRVKATRRLFRGRIRDGASEAAL